MIPVCTIQSFVYDNPRCNCKGTVEAGAEINFDHRIHAYIIKDYRAVSHFMHEHDWEYSYVTVPQEALPHSLR